MSDPPRVEQSGVTLGSFYPAFSGLISLAAAIVS
jgi:hypothetical protein